MRLTATSRAGILAFVTAAVTLFTQVLVHRVVSAKLMNNFAFLIISLTMLGFALSGVVISRWRDRLLENRDDSVTTSAGLFVLSILGAATLFYHLDAGQQFLSLSQHFVLQFGRWLPLALPWTVPFAFCGLILGMLLSDVRLPTRRIYFFDLMGSALGAFGVILAIETLGVELSMIVSAGVMLVATVLLAPPRGRFARAAVLAAAAVTLLSAAERGRVFDMRYPEGSMLWRIQRLPAPYGIEYVAWDPVTRIEVSRIPPPRPMEVSPSLIGDDISFHQRFLRVLTQNNFAYTHAVDYDGRPDSLHGIEQTIYSAAYQATSVTGPRVLVIGVGGGFDVLTALYFGASDVTGVEVNTATLDILTRVYEEYFRGWVTDPRVRLEAAEGRHYLATTPGPWDVIQLSGVDSYSGTPGAAHVFSEAYLYTTEAFDLYLSRLAPEGILNMMRVDSQVPRDMLRALATTVGALRRAGVEHPATHIITLTEVTGTYTAILVKKTPFTEAERTRVFDWASTNRYIRVSGAPDLGNPASSIYQRFLALDDPTREAAFVRNYPFDVSPVDDDRPFFFRSSHWWHLASSNPLIAKQSPPVMESTLLMLLAVVGLATVVCVYLPLRLIAAHGRRVVKGALRYGVFFAALGLGYLAVEVALLQKFGLFLGHPNYALSIVLASLLLTTGLGSLYSEAMVARVGRLRSMSYLVAAMVLAECFLALPLLPRLIDLPFPARVLIVFILITPLGLCLGTFFPTALEQLKPTAAPYVPWAWGINGIFSVLAPILSVGVSMTWGIDALLLAAVPVYLIAGLVLPAPESSARLPAGETG